MAETPKKILIVDDEPDMVLYLSAWLEDRGYEVCSASDGIEGLQAIQSQRPDLVLMDVKMPNQTGLQLYRSMQHSGAYRQIPVIIITGMADFDLFDDGCGPLPEPTARIQKPIDHDLLLSAIQRAFCDPKLLC